MVSVDSLVQFKLHFLLRHLNQEVADLFRHGIAHIPEHDLEIRVNALSDLSHEDIRRVGHFLLFRLVSLLLLTRGWISFVLLLVGTAAWTTVVIFIVSLWNDALSVSLVFKVVREQVVLFGVDHCLDDLSAVVSFLADDVADVLHHLGTGRWEAHEDTVNDLARKELKLGVNILNQLKSWLTQLF